jgi:hypothetical protein
VLLSQLRARNSAKNSVLRDGKEDSLFHNRNTNRHEVQGLRLPPERSSSASVNFFKSSFMGLKSIIYPPTPKLEEKCKFLNLPALSLISSFLFYNCLFYFLFCSTYFFLCYSFLPIYFFLTAILVISLFI